MVNKEYKIGVCTTVDVISGEDFLPPYYKVYSIETYETMPPSVWCEKEFDTLEEAMEYTRKQSKEKDIDGTMGEQV